MAVKKKDDVPIDEKEVELMLTKGKRIMEKLEEVYPEAPKGFLEHKDPFTLLVAVVLSAQSLDIKVNEITPELFRLGGTPEKMRDLGEDKIRSIIKKIGLAPQKAKNIAKLSATLCELHSSKVPDTFEGLESLSGVGHKTASVVMMQAFGLPAFPVDTHVHRLACRWGCGEAKSVAKTEEALKRWFPDPETWGELHTRIILFGREHCPARKHDMEACPICSWAATDESRETNRANPLKFTAAKTHKNPYSIRVVPILEETFVEEQGSDSEFEEKPKPKAASRRRPRSTKQLEAKDEAPVKKSARLVSKGSKKKNEEASEEHRKPAVKARRQRKAKTSPKLEVKVEPEDRDAADDVQSTDATRRSSRLRKRKRAED